MKTGDTIVMNGFTFIVSAYGTLEYKPNAWDDVEYVL